MLSIDVPAVPASDLNAALDHLLPRSWPASSRRGGGAVLAAPRVFGRLPALDSRLAAIDLVFLSLIALLPVPTEILGRYDNSPAPVVIYAVFILVLSASCGPCSTTPGERSCSLRPGSAGGQRGASGSGWRSACRSRWPTWTPTSGCTAGSWPRSPPLCAVSATVLSDRRRSLRRIQHGSGISPTPASPGSRDRRWRPRSHRRPGDPGRDRGAAGIRVIRSRQRHRGRHRDRRAGARS